MDIGNGIYTAARPIGRCRYPAAFAIDPTPREDGTYPCWATARWQLFSGETVTVTGDYLDVAPLDGNPFLGSRAEQLGFDLGIEDRMNRLSNQHFSAVLELVNAQLARRPWARLTCGDGTLRLILVKAHAARAC